MAQGVNKTIHVGNLGKDIDLRSTSGGTSFANFSMACGESWTDDHGQKQERTEWINFKVWGKRAEILAKHTRKGRQLYVEGHLRTEKWEKDGEVRYTTYVQVDNFVFLGGGGRS